MKNQRIVWMVGIVLTMLMWAGQAVAQDGDGVGIIQVVQWASSAEATSEFTPDSWSAERATGEPDVLACEDNVNAWASLAVSDGEALTVMFERAVEPTQVNIYQSYSPGAITRIEVIPADGGDPIPVRNSADEGTGCPRVFSVNLPGGLPESNGVIIYLDQSELGDWNEIDAVELVGTTIGDPEDSWISSVEAGAYPEYEVYSNTGATPGTTPADTGSNDTSDTSTDTNTDPNTNTSGGSTSADFGGEWGTTVTCPDGSVITNAVQFTIIQQRSGGQYRVSALGMNGVDPVLAVMDGFGNMICNDDNPEVAGYGANLPTTGRIEPSARNSQVVFNLNSSNAFENITVVVGGFRGSGGEFLVTVEGMIATSADGTGDPFSVYVSPAMLVSGVDPTAYMFSVVQRFDPTILLVDSNYQVIETEDKVRIGCDDAGTSNCWGQSTSLVNSFITRSNNRNLAGGRLDSMMTTPMNGNWGGYYNYVMTSFGGTYGDYIAAFHLGTTAEGE